MEKAKAAQVVHDMTLAKHIDVEVLAQNESRSRLVVKMLGGDDDAGAFHASRPIGSSASVIGDLGSHKLFRLSDSSGQLSFNLVRDGGSISLSDLDGSDIFLLDDAGSGIWVWEGNGASRAERAAWLKIAQAYVRMLQDQDENAYLRPIAKVQEGTESAAFLKAIKSAA